MVYCCVPLCGSRGGITPGVSYHQFPLDPDLCEQWKKNIKRENLVINDKSASTVVCSKHFLPSDYVPNSKIRRLLPGTVPTVFEVKTDRPAKKPRASQNPQSRQTKRKTEQFLPADYNPSGGLYEERRMSVSTQTNNAANLCPSAVARLRSEVAQLRSRSQRLLQQLVAEQEKSDFYRRNKHHVSVARVVADAQRGDKKAAFLLHQIERYGRKISDLLP
ncbi:hypothetical protein MTO96_017232 [Rhipicephalus appendiculatus]